MPISYTRSINFPITGKTNSPSVSVSAKEVNGSLYFDIYALDSKTSSADLRGLFFDFNDKTKLSNLSIFGEHISDIQIMETINLGRGSNLHGRTNPFDVGIEFGTPGLAKNKIQSASFTLSNSNNDLTLDDIANVDFGARVKKNDILFAIESPTLAQAVSTYVKQLSMVELHSKIYAREKSLYEQEITSEHYKGKYDGSCNVSKKTVFNKFCHVRECSFAKGLSNQRC